MAAQLFQDGIELGVEVLIQIGGGTGRYGDSDLLLGMINPQSRPGPRPPPGGQTLPESRNPPTVQKVQGGKGGAAEVDGHRGGCLSAAQELEGILGHLEDDE